MANISIGDSFLASRRLHSSAESNSDCFAEFFLSNKFIPALVVHPLSEELNRRLGTVLLFLWHVQVINEEDSILSKFWTPDALTTSVHATIDDVLGLVGRGLRGEGKTEECPIIILEAIIQLVNDRDRFSSTCRTAQKSVLLVCQQSAHQVVSSN